MYWRMEKHQCGDEKMNYVDYALICKVLGDSTRIQIVDMLKSGKKCACRLLEAFEIAQPTLSYHMKMLVDCGLVFSEKFGKWTYYALNTEILQALVAFLAKEEKK
jgi:ArsR family transcriptional regulator